VAYALRSRAGIRPEKRQQKTDFATYLGVVLAFLIVFPLQQKGVLSRSVSGMLIPLCAYIVMAIS
jgi:branched-chain amino acid transport system permease protein